ncbi:hypothetical protein [Azospirillum tabaci]|uniref:hypothetical protein n=1 Tax=Azospirillum tabaci TaxID=2752310 RepID=UPI0016614CB9|nr:hypothetical protein [Azospirillum tabaci]
MASIARAFAPIRRPVATSPEEAVALDRLRPVPFCLERAPTDAELAAAPRHDGPIIVRQIPADPRAPVDVLAGLERLERLRRHGVAIAYVSIAAPQGDLQALMVAWTAVPDARLDVAALGQQVRALLPTVSTGAPEEAEYALALVTEIPRSVIRHAMLLAEAADAASDGGPTTEALAAMGTGALRRIIAKRANATPSAAPPVPVVNAAPPLAEPPVMPSVDAVLAMRKDERYGAIQQLLPPGASHDDLYVALTMVSSRKLKRDTMDRTLNGKRSNAETIRDILRAIMALHEAAWKPEVAEALTATREKMPLRTRPSVPASPRGTVAAQRDGAESAIGQNGPRNTANSDHLPAPPAMPDEGPPRSHGPFSSEPPRPQ